MLRGPQKCFLKECGARWGFGSHFVTGFTSHGSHFMAVPTILCQIIAGAGKLKKAGTPDLAGCLHIGKARVVHINIPTALQCSALPLSFGVVLLKNPQQFRLFSHVLLVPLSSIPQALLKRLS